MELFEEKKLGIKIKILTFDRLEAIFVQCQYILTWPKMEILSYFFTCGSFWQYGFKNNPSIYLLCCGR